MDPCVLGFEQDSGSKADDDHQDPRQCAGITHVEVRKRRAVEMRWKQGVLSAVLLAVVEPPQAAREPAIRTAMAALIMRLFFILIFRLQSLGRFLVCPFRCLYHTHFSTI